MDDEGVVPGVNEAKSYREARNYRAYGQALCMSVSILSKLRLRNFDLVNIRSYIGYTIGFICILATIRA